MKISVTVENSKTKKLYDLSEVVSTLEWSTTLDAQPGKLKFSIPLVKGFDIPMASKVTLRIDNIGIFYGYVFECRYDEKEIIQYIALDMMRYLKNKMAYLLHSKTATQIFNELCDDIEIPHQVLANCDWEVSARTHDGKTIYEIIDYGYAECLIHTKQWFFMYADLDKIVQQNILNMKTNLVFTNDQNIIGYKYKKSIDKNTANQVVLVQENTEKALRVVYLEPTKEKQSNAHWGLLRYYEKVDKNASATQIKKYGDGLLAIKNRETEQLSLKCLGAPNYLRAGHWIYLKLDPLVVTGFKNMQDYLITDCTHIWSNNEHIVKLEVSQYSLEVDKNANK